MGIESQALAVILVPLLGSLLIPLAGWAGQRKATGWLAVLIIGSTHLLTWPLLAPALSGRTGAHEPGLVPNVWHLSTLTVVSLAIYTLGSLMYAAARSGRNNAAEAFNPLAVSPALGPAFRMAGKKAAKKFQMIIYLDRCIHCARCAEVCPKDAIYLDEEFEIVDFTRAALRLVSE